MLRRTRAAQVVPVFEVVRRKYPRARDLASARPAQVRRDFGSLGLAWRIGQLRNMAKELDNRFSGTPPCDRNELMSLPGVSDYVADAVLVFSCGKPRAVIDANVARVVARYFGFREHAEARRDRVVIETARSLVPMNAAREYNFAMLDVAALVCTPSKPKHEVCPLRRTCKSVHR
jgi:A/G-specific adenine glycosylase